MFSAKTALFASVMAASMSPFSSSCLAFFRCMIMGVGLFTLSMTCMTLSPSDWMVSGLRIYASMSDSAASATISLFASAVTMITGMSLSFRSSRMSSRSSTPFILGIFQSIMARSMGTSLNTFQPSLPSSPKWNELPYFSTVIMLRMDLRMPSESSTMSTFILSISIIQRSP